MSYIGTYLFDVLGMKPEAAMAYLKASLIKDRFRSFRIQRDKTFDPNLYELAIPEEPSFGRVTFQLKDGVVSEAYCEGLGWELHTPTPWPPQPEGLRPGEVFFLGPPVFLGRLGVRRELQVLPPEQPVRGWKIEAIESYHVINGKPSNLPPLPPVPPPKQKIAPDFEYLG